MLMPSESEFAIKDAAQDATLSSRVMEEDVVTTGGRAAYIAASIFVAGLGLLIGSFLGLIFGLFSGVIDIGC